MSSYLNIPGSNVTITDGTIVMLARFPGTKWVVHNGWYSYTNRNYYGWYFCSIPAQTTLPVSPQDLAGLTVVSASGSPAPSIDGPQFPGYPAPGPDFPGPDPGPYPGGNFGPMPYPPIPPVPPPPHPHPHPHPGDRPAYFGEKELAALNASFITVANAKELEEIDTSKIPNGKIVAVNSIEGERKFFIWNSVDDKWDNFDFVPGYDDLVADVENIGDQVAAIQDTIDNIPKLPQLFNNNTIIVSADDWIADSGVAIGDDTIEESAETASATTVATEKAVVKLITEKIAEIQTEVEEVQPTWHDF